MAGFPEGIKYFSFAELDSTNEYARRLIADGHNAGEQPVWVRADVQTAGRGRLGRHWTSTSGNLMASYVCAPQCARENLAELGFVAGLAVYDALAEVLLNDVTNDWANDKSKLTLKLKWPNDVLLEDAKIAGLLLETLDKDMRNLAIGIGVNLVSAPTDTPYPAIALKTAIGVEVSPDTFLKNLAHHLQAWFIKWEQEGFAALKPEWLSRAKGLGETISVRQPRETVTGKFIDLTDDGRLCLETAAGEVMTISAGDVYFPQGAENE